MTDPPVEAPMSDPSPRAWLRLNAYGLLIVGLTTLSILNIRDPEQSNVAQAVGYVSVWQPVWQIGIFVAGLLLLLGFARSRTGPELAGLALLGSSLTLQASVAVAGAGWVGAIDQLLSWLVVVSCSVLRASVLLSKDGLVFTIPGRSPSGGA